MIAFEPPSLQHVMGTDEYGRDIFSRILCGTRFSLFVAVLAFLISGSIGSILGLISGYFGGKIESLIMRIMDAWLSFPSLIMAMAVATAFERSLTSASIAIGISGIPLYARIVRAQTLLIKNMDYIEAARATGVGVSRILFKHILPGCWAPITVQGSLQMGYSILTLAALSFVGLGAPSPLPEWGLMITEGRHYIISGEWWIVTFPGLAIMMTVMGFNVLGDTFRDIMDPRIYS